ncbi:MAG TPA: hypothetical protein VGO47_03515, partial [Chlamydiales bacterium]|nr:hypothetical protein [Chlamydiales bacterium]
LSTLFSLTNMQVKTLRISLYSVLWLVGVSGVSIENYMYESILSSLLSESLHDELLSPSHFRILTVTDTFV